MRILYLHQYFVTPRSFGGTRSYEFARRFVAAGHEVDMVTTWRESRPKSGWFETTEDGIRVHWLPVPYSNHMSYPRRAAAFGHFALSSALQAMRIPADVVFATSTPLTIAIPGIIASARQHVPMVFEVRDLWPEAPRQMGALRDPVSYYLARRLELTAYRRADHIVALSPGMRDGVLARGIPSDKVTVIPNSADLDLFNPAIDGTAARQRLSVGDRLMVLHFGAMGPANGLDLVVDAASELQSRGCEEAVFVLHGEGKMRAHLEAEAARRSLRNVIFSDSIPSKRGLAEVVAAADVCLTVYKDVPYLRSASPNKMFDSFAAGKPVMTNMPGWLSQLVEENDCGFTTDPTDPRAFADRVEHILAHRERLPSMGRNARALAEREFSRDQLAAKLLQVLVTAADSARPD